MQRPTQAIVVRTRDGLDDAFAQLWRGPLAVDTETTGLNWYRDRVGALNLAAGNTTVIAIRDALGPAVRWLARQVTAERELVFHHAKFDLHMLRSTFGLHVPYPVHDTAVQSFVLDNRGAWAYLGRSKAIKPHGLKALASVFVDPEAPDHEKLLLTAIRQRGGAHKGDWMVLLDTEDEHLFTRYSGLDAWYTLRLHEMFMERITHWIQPPPDHDDDPPYPSLRSVYERERWLILAFRDMEARGIMANRVFLEEWRDQLAVTLEQQRAELWQLAGKRELNWNSVPQLKVLLYAAAPTGLSLRGGPATDAVSLLNLTHPIGPALVKYRETFKQWSSYATSLLTSIEADGAIHPTFKSTGAETGRTSCENPNLQQQTRVSGVRKAYHPRTGLVFRAADFCLVGNTMVETLTGLKPIKSIQRGEKVFTWREGRIAWGEVTKHACTGRLTVFKVTLDNGQSFTATGEHEMVQRDGGKIKVQSLLPGTKLAAFRRGTGGVGRGRETVYSLSNRLYTYTHHLVAEAHLGSRPKTHDVHHIDGDGWNNGPNNLMYMERSEHKSLHAFTTVNQRKRVRALRIALQSRRSYTGRGNPNWSGGSVERTCVQCHASFQTYPPSRPRKRCSCCRRPGRIPQDAMNHKVVNIVPAGVQWVYHITVEADHNFALGCGVISANSQVEMRFASHFAREQMLIDGFVNDPEFDTHGATAAKMFGTLYNPKSQHRKFAKIINFTRLFGGGENKVTEQLINLINLKEAIAGCKEFHLTLDPELTPWRQLARAIIERFKRELPMLTKVIRTEADVAEQRGYVMNAFGGHRFLDDDRWYKAFNTRVQGTAGIMAKEGLVRVYRECQLNRGELAILLLIHDEVFYESTGDPRTDRRVLELMADRKTYRVPIIADMQGSATDWQSKVKIAL